jgi:Transposase DDE domain
MDDKILALYCLCTDFLKALHHREDRQQKMTDAEVMTTALVAMVFFGGNFAHARALLGTRQYMPRMLSRGRCNRRLHVIQELFVTLFHDLGEAWKELNVESVYVIDSFPVTMCDNDRIPRAKLYQQEVYRGYSASKKRYFYGVKIHLMVTAQGQPVECFLTPGSCSDVRALQAFQFDGPTSSSIYADKAYNDYGLEDLLKESCNIELSPIRKKNSKRVTPPYSAFVQHYHRKRIETAGSLIERVLPKTIHAVTARGFELKVFLFVLAYSINCL